MYQGRGGEPETEGLPQELADQILADHAAREEEIEVWPENHEAVELFDQCATQWRLSMGGPTGLDYAGVEALMRIQRIRDRADVMSRLQVMEREALDVMSQQR